MKIDIVTHCWNYSRLLCYQLSSLVLFPPKKAKVCIHIFATPSDNETWKAIWYYRNRMPKRVCLSPNALDKPELFRRGIGRNIAALNTEADWVWFTDADYLFRENCLDTLATIQPDIDCPMIYPRITNKNITHAHGDKAIEAMTLPEVQDIDPADFEPVRLKKAIGGIQIVAGDYARKHGYNKDNPKWLKPHNGDRFARCQCDVPFRKSLVDSKGNPAPPKAVDIPGVYRIRHTSTGWRDPGTVN